MARIYFCLLLLAGPTQAAMAADDSSPLPDRIQFNRDVRSILSDNCFACHGPDANKREAELRLDTRGGLLEPHGAAPAVVVAGKPDESEVWRRVASDDPELRMPPAAGGKQLSPRELAVIKRWIEQGADWEGHWAFEPIKRPTPPAVVEPGFTRGAIDAFILAGLRARAVAPSPPADRRTLLRRLSFDLTGLPPTPEEVDAFVADASTTAYETQAERLLSSPRYGERMALWWLDLVRYADSVGYHGDQPVSVYPFREYVINAFNANKRFDQFTIEQLAGDLLPDPTLEQRIASGYNRLGMMSAEGGVQEKEYLAKYIAERARNVSGAWLGATLGCAECHDHKYDPFTSRDFYALEAFFADVQERGLYSGAHESGDWGPRVQVPAPEQAARLAALDQQLAVVKTTLDMPTPELEKAQADWEAARPSWQSLSLASFSSAGGARMKRLDDGSILVDGQASATDVYTIVVKDLPAGVTAVRLEALPHESLPQGGPGRAGNGNFVLTEFRLAVRAAEAADESPIALANPTASIEQTLAAEGNPYGKWAIAAAIDNDAKGPTLGWAILPAAGKPQTAVFETSADVAGGPGSIAAFTVAQNFGGAHALGRFRLSATTAPRPVKIEQGFPEDVAAALATAPEQRERPQRERVAAYYRSIAPALEPARQKLAGLEQERDSLNKQIPTTLVTVAVEPRPIRLLKRGNWMDDSGELLAPATPGFLPRPAQRDGRLTRLDLAGWIVAPDNPLTARTLANRLWKLFFGSGLSRRVDDLGAQGEWPSHPELLDYLAGRLIDSGWDIKQVVREIVASGAYRQSSLASQPLREADPDNRWLARQGHFRLDAELVRDNALAISGLLVEKLGGPSVKPYQPPGYWAYLNFPVREWQNGSGEELYRRGLYTHWQRQYLHPSLLAFDAPSREECAADRPRSNTPLQSLVLLNDATYVEAARVFAESIVRGGGASSPERLSWAYRRALARDIRPAELEIMLPFIERQLAGYRGDEAAAAQLSTVGGRPAASDLAPVEIAAWTSVARVILNLHETVTRN